MTAIFKYTLQPILHPLLLITAAILLSSYTIDADTIPITHDGNIRKSIYPQAETQRSKLYNWLWGKHYRKLYGTPIKVDTANVRNMYGGLSIVDKAPSIHGIMMADAQEELYLLRPVDGSATFLKSGFFRTIYNKKDYKETYLDQFIEDAYTITNPFAFRVADNLAGNVGLISYNPQVYYIPPSADIDTTSMFSLFNDRIVAVYKMKNLSLHKTVVDTEHLLANMRQSKANKVNAPIYIRERLFDILVGDWNKPPESWFWLEEANDAGHIYTPIIVDRACSFPRVDGALFKGILGMFGLKCITDYDYHLSDLKKFNQFTLALDIALTESNGEQEWLREAEFIQKQLTDEVIDEAFKLFPPEIQGIDTELIKRKLKVRRNTLSRTASDYYNLMQKTPIVTATDGDDRIEVDRLGTKDLQIRILDQTDKIVFDKKYDKRTNEIWIYGLDGNDKFVQTGPSRKRATPIALIGGQGKDSYNLVAGKKTRIYEYKSDNQSYDSIASAKLIETTIDSVLVYDYMKLKYRTFDITPWGIYDSDLGLYLGAYATWTMYGFKRVPYTYRHRIGYNYLNGFMYIGSFPSFDERKTFVLEAYIGTARNFTNFFGYGNQTGGGKDRERNYNRVKISKYSITPSYYYNFTTDQRLIAKTSFDIYDMRDTHDRFINEYYPAGHKVYDTKYYNNTSLTYELKKELPPIQSSVNLSVTGGWVVNLLYPDINFAYSEAKFSFNIKLTDHLTWATQVNGKALFSNQYEFFQSASADLRGARNNRYIGRQTLYQHTDLRYDMGNLQNPFMPLMYGVFGGFDYGRVWYPGEYSKKWHPSFGGGFWLTLFKNYTGKFSYFGSHDGSRFTFGLGMGF